MKSWMMPIRISTWKIDPKLSWALRHPEQFPVDINKADYEMLSSCAGHRGEVGEVDCGHPVVFPVPGFY